MIRVMVVDDSPLFRRVLSDLLSGDPEIGEVVTAGDGNIALRKLKQARPDVITMDIEMPRIGGLEVIEKIMATHPTPIIIVSALRENRSALVLRAMELGVVDVIQKPGGTHSGRIGQITDLLLETVKSAAKAKMKPKGRVARKTVSSKNSPLAGQPSSVSGYPLDVVAIGASTGGPMALKDVLIDLPASFPVCIVAALHMPPTFTPAFAGRLDSICAMHIKEAKDGEILAAGNVLIAPGDLHLKIAKNGNIAVAALESSAKVNNHRPSIDVLMRSVAEAFGKKALSVIMTGMGKDGADGIAYLKSRGGYVIAQDETSSIIYGMNRVVVENGDSNEALPLDAIADRLIRLTSRT